MRNKYLLYASLPIIALTIVGVAHAESNLVSENNPMSDLVNAIAQKFNLNATDVQQVFDEQRTQREAQRQERMAEIDARRKQEFTDRINQAVTDGKLTQEQANKILAKRDELKTQRNVNREEMRTKMDSLRQWMVDNNIPQEYMFMGFGMGRMRGGPCGF